MKHDLNLKTTFSYGSGTPDEVAQAMKERGVTVLSFADLFSVEQNSGPGPWRSMLGVNIVTGSEWYTKCDMEGVERVDLIFLGFTQTPQLEAWVRRERKRIELKKKALPKDINYDDSWKYKSAFGKMVSDQNLRRSYFGTLPMMETVADIFRRAGAKMFLSGLPFTEGFSVQCRLVKYLKNLGLEGAVVFKDESEYQDTEAEVSGMLDLCKYAGILPIVGSGVWNDYGLRTVAMESVAPDAFSYLTKQVVEKLSERR